ncbi:MAG TPA: DUF1501 domain-containing protein, partial [Pirellulales bacterium]|nr:DUF1501 domain-containing protein [Pirellulales bacterium]
MPPHRLPSSLPSPVSRREFLSRAGGGFGTLALAALLSEQGLSAGEGGTAHLPPGAAAAPDPLAPRPPHFEPRVQRVIYLFMHGGPSHVDLFDPKPDLVKYAGQPLPESFGSVMTRRKVAANPLLGPV